MSTAISKEGSVEARTSPARIEPPYVVGIGASAGGLEALERFFDNVPSKAGMAFVVVQHLSPDFKSVMGELLARHTAMTIKLVEDGMPIEPDHVYLIPPKKEMIISGGRLLLSERDRQYELTLPIDVFFRSLAQDCGARAVAIVLSGGGSDGSRGIRDVREAGGLVIVQDASAQFDGMPRTAIDAGVASHVLAPESMPSAIVEHVEKQRAHRDGGTGLGEDGGPVLGQTALDTVYRMLEKQFGIDFTHYKPSTVTRRIERRVQLARADDLGTYLKQLRESREELDVLYRDLLIGVTRFFRNEEAFEVLSQRVLPELLENLPRGAAIRVWVAGCATGEEVYSLAIVLHEVMSRVGERPVKIFASDVHRGSLETASRGIYNEAAVRNVSPGRLQRYFTHVGPTYQVVPELRQQIVFAPHNVIRDAPFTRIDLISCRNLLIYLQPPAQQKALSLFHFALNRGGVAFLGPSESAGPLANDFETLHRHWRIFRKHSDVRIPVDARFQPAKVGIGDLRLPVQDGQGQGGPLARYSLTKLLGTYDKVLDAFMPPGLLLNEHGEMIHAFAGGSRFLKPHDGRQGLDVLDAVETELKTVLSPGLKRALREPQPVGFKGVRITVDGEEKEYRVVIRKFGGRPAAASHFVVTFEAEDTRPPRPPAPSGTEIDLAGVPREQLRALEEELSSTKASLQATIEELETSNEELQAANEELLTSNEELQSTNEELQSVNEELYTVNAEYQKKIAELTELTNDMDNLLSSTDIGTIFLDAELRIRRFTPRSADTFRLLPQDIGRSIETFTHSIDHPELFADLKRVRETGEPIERELAGPAGSSLLLRILPYRAKGSIAGVVVTLVDVTGMKAAEDALFHERFLLNSLLFNVPDAIYFRGLEGKFIRVNEAMASRFKVDAKDLTGKTPFDVFPQEVAIALHEQDAHVLRTGDAQHYRLEKSEKGGAGDGGDSGDEWTLVTRVPLRDPSDRVVGVIAISRDVTKQRRAEERIHQDVVRRDRFLAMLSHELRNPLGAVVTATALLKPLEHDEKTKKLLTIVDRQSQQMARLLDDLLEVSRVTQNKIELRMRTIDLGAVAKDAADAVRSAITDRGLELRTEIDAAPLFVNGDPARLLQVQVNLLNNAAKYTPHGGHVWFRIRREDDDAVISVRDDGVGIPKDMTEAIFDLFVQSRRTLDRAEGGLGVGLTLVRSLVSMHGGNVVCHSDGRGQGSEFVIRLPLGSGAIEEPRRSPRRMHLPRGARIVIIEDNRDSRDLLCQLLSLAGFECHAADNGASGLALIDDVRPDVAIVDVGLPEVDGFAVARRIRAEPGHDRVSLIALTGYGQSSDRAQALEAGFDEHLVKPINAESLLQLLDAQ
jgi:two-component system CheB/CheR fusion protein